MPTAVVKKNKKRIERARIRTWNLLIRSQTRYPLRHTPLSKDAVCKIIFQQTQRDFRHWIIRTLVLKTAHLSMRPSEARSQFIMDIFLWQVSTAIPR